MPLVTASPRSLQNGSILTEFTNSTNTSPTTYTFPTPQTSIIIENSGEKDIFVTVGSYTDQIIAANVKWKVDVSFTSFSIRSDVNSQEFIVTAILKEAQDLSGVNVQLAEKATKAELGDIALIPQTNAIQAIKDNDSNIKTQYLNVKFPPVGLAPWKSSNTVSVNTANVQAMINYASTNNKILYFPNDTYPFDAPLVIPTKQGFEMRGAGNRNTVFDIQHGGNAIEMVDGQSHVIKDIKIDSSNPSYRYVYTGIYVKNGLLHTFDNVTIFMSKNGIVFEGPTYVCDVANLYVYYFKEKGVYFKRTGAGAFTTPNGNRVHIKFIRGMSKDTVGSYGVYLEGGEVNTFVSGQISDCETAIYQASGLRNYFEKMWIEGAKTTIEILAGSMIVDCHGAFINKISDGALIFNNSGQASPYSDLTKDPLKEDKSLKALWFFNEGSGSRILDKSGNKKHATLAGTPTWVKDGSWGTGAYFKYSDGRKISVPVDVVDWTQPFTYFYNYSMPVSADWTAAPVGLYVLQNNGTVKYLSAGATVSSLVALSYDGVTVESPASKGTGRYTSKTIKNIWQFIYVDPIAKTIELLDPFGEKPLIQLTQDIGSIIPASVTLTGREHVSNVTEGIMSMAGFFQRKLSMGEVYDIVNKPDRPFQQFDKKVQLDTTLVSSNGSSYKVTVADNGTLTTTLI